MKLPLSWIREFVPVELPPARLAHLLTMAGAEVEDLAVLGADWEQVVVGRVASLERHPSLEALWVARIELRHAVVAVATAATNLRVGDLVPLVLPGGRVGGRTIEARDFDGLTSQGMLLSADELGLAPDRQGIYVLDVAAQPGQPLQEVLGEVIFDFKITPNRPDEMNVLGIAREVAALTGQPLTVPPLEPLAGGSPAASLVAVEIPAPDLCLRYTAAVVQDISVGPSPGWVQRRLHCCGVRPISNVVDVTNYVMLEQGQPLHAFDADLLAEGRLVIRRAWEGERIVTLDGQGRELSPEMLAIADARQAQAVAGVMGGLASEVSERTRHVVIESANFEPMSIRRTARALRLSTEASKRFERGLDPGQTARAAQRATNLMVRLAGGRAAAGLVDLYPTRLPKRRIFITPERLSTLLGKRYAQDEIAQVLTRLEFEVQPQANGLEVVAPGHRRDVEGPADLAEEVARVTGYEAIPDTLLSGRLAEPRPNVARDWERRARSILVGCGLQEVITYSLVEPSTPARLDSRAPWPVPSTVAAPGLASPLDGLVRVANPLSAEQSALRTTLLASLLDILRANLRHSERVAIFELARVYLPPLAPLPREMRHLGIALAGARAPRAWNREQGELDFFDLKGVVEGLLRALGLGAARFRRAAHVSYHPGRVAEVVLPVAGRPEVVLGTLGQVHPRVAERFDLQGRAVFAAELDFEALASRAGEVGHAAAPPRFPGVEVDLAVQVQEAVTHEEVHAVLIAAGGELLDRAELFDVYRGEALPSGTKSLAYSLTFRSPERTLTDEEAVEVQAHIERELAHRLGATIRGRS
ncbi:MAG: phenylalanine--tRNA ligase subunit beta [Chloroflexi bacterium]|nr:phenylalanine--tRNA ligase subunit beta [Chloroflexota bacterium]